MKKLLKTIVLIVCTFSIGLLSSASPFCFAKDDTICGNNNVPAEVKAASGCPNEKVAGLDSTITNILNAIIGVLGLVAVIFVLVGGINYMTSSGDAAKLEKAKKTILYACIGLAICALAFAIVNWAIAVINKSS